MNRPSSPNPSSSFSFTFAAIVATVALAGGCVDVPLSPDPLDDADGVDIPVLGEDRMSLAANESALFRGDVATRDAYPDFVLARLREAQQVAYGEANAAGGGYVQIFDVTGAGGVQCRVSDGRPVCDEAPAAGKGERLFVVSTFEPTREKGGAGLLPEVALDDLDMLHPDQGVLVKVPRRSLTGFGIDNVLPRLPGRIGPGVGDVSLWPFGTGGLCHPQGHCEGVPPQEIEFVRFWIQTVRVDQLVRNRDVDAGE